MELGYHTAVNVQTKYCSRDAEAFDAKFSMHCISHCFIEIRITETTYSSSNVVHLCGTSVVEHVIVFNTGLHQSVIFNPLSVDNYETLHCTGGPVKYEFLFILDIASLETCGVLEKLGFVLVSTFCTTRTTSNFRYRY